MNVLGLNFGHDAGVSLVVDGVFERHWEKERHARVRHAMGLTADEILGALEYLGCALGEIDAVALTSTQMVPIMLFGEIELRPRGADWPRRGGKPLVTPPLKGDFYATMRQPGTPYTRLLAWSSSAPRRELLVRERLLGARARDAAQVWTLSRMHAFHAADRSPYQLDFDLELELAGRKLPAAYVAHHLCHAWYAFAESGRERALIVTMDGARSGAFDGGGVFFGAGDQVMPVIPHAGFWHGQGYNHTGETLGLGGRFEVAGKLMGLAAWGKPAFYDPMLVGNWVDLPAEYTEQQRPDPLLRYWLDKHHLPKTFADLRECEVPGVVEADVAASVQAMFEQTMLAVVDAAVRVAANSRFDHDAIMLSGGCALNCPANSLLWRRFGKPMFVPPAVNDEGIAAGAALALSAKLGARPRAARRGPGAIAYKGKRYAVRREVATAHAQSMKIEETASPAEFLARRIRDGAVVGLFEGGAEIGPRALGHRSLIASPLIAANWPTLNRIKQREPWRPFAPIVLPDDAPRYFDGFPADSHYMLFNARVTSKALPAITHVDGTARVQVAHPDNGFVWQLLHAFRALTGCGVLLNTSFNGRGEPMVETPAHALDAAVRLGLDFLYLDGLVLASRSAASAGSSSARLSAET